MLPLRSAVACRLHILTHSLAHPNFPSSPLLPLHRAATSWRISTELSSSTCPLPRQPQARDTDRAHSKSRLVVPRTSLCRATLLAPRPHSADPTRRYIPLWRRAAGFFTLHSIVLAEGVVLSSGLFQVNQLGFAPPEPRAQSIAALGNVDPFRQLPVGVSGSAEAVAASATPSAAALQNSMVVILSEIHLDNPKALAKLITVFSGYEGVGSSPVRVGRQQVPLASFFTFVLCGNFTTMGFEIKNSRRSDIVKMWGELANLLAKCPVIAKHSQFVLVPGPRDLTLGSADVLPRGRLPQALCSEMLKVVANCHLASNPARVCVCGQMLVIFREDLLLKMRRNCVIAPCEDETEDYNEHLVKTVVDGGHLFPLPMIEVTKALAALHLPVHVLMHAPAPRHAHCKQGSIYWKHDHALWLHPAPEVLVLADTRAQFSLTYGNAPA